MSAEPAPARLRQGVGLIGVVTLGAGTAIGVSIFSVLQPAAEIAGPGLLSAMVLAALPMLLFATSYAFLAAAYPVSGASYEWPRRFLHPLVGFAIAWLRILGSVGALVILAQVFGNYLGMAVPLPLKPVMAAAITLVFALNYVGVAVAARAQSLLMILLLIVLAVFVATGLPAADRIPTSGIGAVPLSAVAACVPLMVSLFLGIESAVEIGEEVRNGQRAIPLGIALAVALTILVYGGVALTALSLVPPEALAASKAPLLDAARVSLGRLALPLVVGAASISILKTMNATAMVFARSLFAMARTGAIPEGVARTHARFGTPHRAVLVGWVLAMAGLLLPSSLVFLLLAVNIPTMLKYLACCLCAARVAKGRVEAPREAPLFPPALVIWVSYAGAIAAALIIGAGLGADWRPYAMLAAWLAIGLVYRWQRERKAIGRDPPAA